MATPYPINNRDEQVLGWGWLMLIVVTSIMAAFAVCIDQYRTHDRTHVNASNPIIYTQESRPGNLQDTVKPDNQMPVH